MKKKSEVSYSKPLPNNDTGGGKPEEMTWAQQHAPMSALAGDDMADAGMPPELMMAQEEAAGARTELQANQQQAEMQLQQHQQQAEATEAKAKMDAEMVTQQSELKSQMMEQQAEAKAQQAELAAETEIAKRDAQIGSLEQQIASIGANADSAAGQDAENQSASRKATVAKLDNITSRLNSIGSATRTHLGLPKVAAILNHCDNAAYRGWVKYSGAQNFIAQAQQDNPALQSRFSQIDEAVPTPQESRSQEWKDIWSQGPSSYLDKAYSGDKSYASQLGKAWGGNETGGWAGARRALGGIAGGLGDAARNVTVGTGANLLQGFQDIGRGTLNKSPKQAFGGLGNLGLGVLGSTPLGLAWNTGVSGAGAVPIGAYRGLTAGPAGSFMSGAEGGATSNIAPESAAPGGSDFFSNLLNLFGSISSGFGQGPGGRTQYTPNQFRDLIGASSQMWNKGPQQA